MSGEKRAQTRLDRQHEQALQRSQELRSRLREAQITQTRLEAELATFEGFYREQAEQYMPTEYQELVRQKTDLENTGRELNALEREAQGLTVPRSGGAFGTFARSMTRLEEETQRRLQEQRSAQEALGRGMESIRSDLQERMDTAERERRVQTERRARVRALAESFTTRMQVDTALQRIRGEAQALLTHAQDNGPLEESDIQAYEQEFEGLIRRAWDQELEARRQRHKADLLHDAFEEAGFMKKEDRLVEATSGGQEVHLVHEASQAELFVRISSDIERKGDVRLLMEGAAGQEHQDLEPAAFCGDSLDDIIARAKALGLIIDGVSMKGPDGLWRDLSTEDERREALEQEMENLREDEQRMQHAQGISGR